MQFVYLPRESTFLVERWLQTEPGGAPVCLVREGPDEAAALRLKDKYPAVRQVLSLDNLAGVRVALAQESGRIVLPASTASVPLRYQPPLQQPDITPFYGLVRRLHQAGFREFTLYQLSGVRQLRVPHLLEEFHHRHAGKRCFVVGNGPSLNEIDMGRLKEEITLGANRCFLGYGAWGFSFTYWGVYDPLQIEEYAFEYEAHVPRESVKFFPFAYLPYLRVENACPVNIQWPKQHWREFSNEPGHIYRGYSVIYMLLQIAAVMGCNPIILVGLDHRYHVHKRYWPTRMLRTCGRWLEQYHGERPWYRAGKAAADAWFRETQHDGPPEHRLWQANDAQGPTHFDARYTSERKRFLMPRPQDAERDYECALEWARASGVEILNATPGTALEVFPKVSFDSLF
ncbi:MAG: hypothetical protein HYV26_05965 [Candidatus Hydrogenedentes bacterium]|nr:hypothetical protein [Candidatus Hydrogenedentota bacterium]